MHTKLIQNCAILRQSEPDVVTIEEGMDVLIEGNIITHIRETGKRELDQVNEIIPAQGMVCLPGLINTHAAENVSQTESSLEVRGKTPVQVLADTGILELPTIIAHGSGIVADDIPLLKQAPQVGVAHAPKTYLKLGSDLTPISALREAGIPIGLATDGAASNSTLDLFEVLRLMTMMQKFVHQDPEQMPIATALDIAFRGSAAVLGLEQSLGQIEEGFVADLMLVNLSGAHHQPLHNLSASLIFNVQAPDVQTVLCNGQVLMQDRHLKTLDKAHIIQQVQKSMARLAVRVPEKRIQLYNP